MTDRQTPRWRSAGLVLVLLLITGSVILPVVLCTALWQPQLASVSIPKPRPTFTEALPDAIEMTLESCVHVTNVTQGCQGSAVAIAPDILITARHVVKGSCEFLITAADGVEYTAHQAISNKEHDIAFIKMDKPVLVPVVAGSIRDLRLGQSVFVIGGSFGKMNWPNVTAGIVSCLNRDLESYGVPKDFGWGVLWQVDAAAYPGNSGGPIFDLNGVVRGVMVGVVHGTECLSYCMPLDVIEYDIAVIRAMFVIDEYRVEEVPEKEESYYY